MVRRVLIMLHSSKRVVLLVSYINVETNSICNTYVSHLESYKTDSHLSTVLDSNRVSQTHCRRIRRRIVSSLHKSIQPGQKPLYGHLKGTGYIIKASRFCQSYHLTYGGRKLGQIRKRKRNLDMSVELM